ncbi:winged helix-turn-helix domain-containing protein [Primorskyibacter aestuariivivens]|uniref:winged helix-turn-helix domain-containing tetratricopeptide repeat protein n=1 Tax=Primorskyibacter aestuariivivens TaxID=1888912 RepID=UPI002300DDB0|nr:winged helix-turn-helix domain-containing protein [Primorskyibacter aestuariivivens]MDA7427024.1 winged helix-turn-helix domain-containing protein [Primorskyibacter aestuariivivens]
MKIYEITETGRVVDSDGGVREANGEAVDLRPQTRQVLALLVRSPNQTVSKEDFVSAVWEGRQVSEDSLVQCIAEIRAALGDTDREIIQTLPRKGYRFVPPVPPVRPGISPRIAALVAVAVLLVVVIGWVFGMPDRGHERAPVVAVLPLDDLSPAEHQGVLNDALSEGIITELARFPQFRVVARNSSFQFRASPTDVREIGGKLGAGYVMEGSQQFDGQRLKVTVQLVETATGAHLFADKYERELDDFFAVQDQIVRQVASVVGQEVLSDMPQRALPKDVDSRLRGLQARRIMTQLTYENWQKALALEETSIREEPGSAWGYIGKSLMLGAAARLGWMTPREAVLDESVELAKTALRLDPENYMSHFALARVLSRRSENAESILHFQRAARLNPSDSIILIGMSVPLLYSGQTDAAIEALQKAAEVDPLHGDWLRWQLGWAYWQKNQCDKGLEAMQSMSSPPSASNKTLAALLVCLDRLPEAQNAMADYLAANPGYTRANEAQDVPTDWKPEGTPERWMEAMIRAGMP